METKITIEKKYSFTGNLWALAATILFSMLCFQVCAQTGIGAVNYYSPHWKNYGVKKSFQVGDGEGADTFWVKGTAIIESYLSIGVSPVFPSFNLQVEGSYSLNDPSGGSIYGDGVGSVIVMTNEFFETRTSSGDCFFKILPSLRELRIYDSDHGCDSAFYFTTMGEDLFLLDAKAKIRNSLYVSDTLVANDAIGIGEALLGHPGYPFRVYIGDAGIDSMEIRYGIHDLGDGNTFSKVERYESADFKYLETASSREVLRVLNDKNDALQTRIVQGRTAVNIQAGNTAGSIVFGIQTNSSGIGKGFVYSSGAFANSAYDVITATNGGTHNVGYDKDEVIITNNVGTYTVTLPEGTTDGQKFTLTIAAVITTLNVNAAAGQSTAFTIPSGQHYQHTFTFKQGISTWY